VPHILKKRKRILSATKKRYFRTHSKFGVEIPKSVERALQIDKETGTTFGAM
jgi:response regulator RpfG family c-di-GMP phosphodiesterase